jgi:AcrR family transcriptional regulator
MADALTPERIIETAGEVLRRYGPDKTNVVDVARALGVSHGSVYRHFGSKAALRDAVLERWLKRGSEPLERIARGKGPALTRLRKWFDALIQGKRQKVNADPELFAMSRTLFAEARAVVAAHIATLIGQIETILADAVAEGQLPPATDVRSAAEAMFYATGRFHDPAHAAEWTDPRIDEVFDGVWALLVAGLRAQ